MAERNNPTYNSSDDEEDEESEEESDSSNNSSSDSSLSSSSSSSGTPSHRQNQSSSEETSENAEELCPAARLLVCNRRHPTITPVHKKTASRKKSPPRKSSRERKSSERRKSSTVSNAGTQTFELNSEIEINNRNNCSQDVSRRRKKSEDKKSTSRKHKIEKSDLNYSRSKQNFQTQTEDFGVQVKEVSETQNSHTEDLHRKKSSKAGRMNSLFMQEKPIEEEDEDDVRNRDDDRPIRGMSSMKVREDTMDGAEAPDHDPPQRRRTLEDISITELSAHKTVLPPEYPEDESPQTLLPCVTCGRTFNPSALDRHRKVCQKIASSSKKKQVFNAHTQRFEAEDTAAPGSHGGRACTPERGSRGASPTPQKKKKTSRWREKHQEFLRTIRAARGSPEGDADAGGAGSSVPSDYIQCPVCGRHFGPKAADRHIDWCKEQSTRLRSNSADAQLVERLKSRTKYVPPKPGQGGWRAPKKTDVISSIPPPSSSSTDRRISPPPIAPPRRGVSPSPLAQRRGISPAPLSRQHSTASLGRSTARSVSSILQAVTGNYSSPYGQRHSTGGPHSGYATPSSYSAYGASGPRTPSLTRSGSFSGSGGAQNFVRSASLRVPGSRRAHGERKARARDLASDMLASVCLGSSPARGEPEGDEAEDFSSRETTLSPPPFAKSLLDSPFDLEFDSPKYEEEKYNSLKYNSSKKDSVLESYDPYSAAEMQMQALLGPSFESETKDEGGRGTGLSAAGMGVGELGTYERSHSNFRKHSTSPPPKDRLPSLKIPSSPGLTRSYRQTSPLSSLTQDGISPTPSGEFFNDKRFWRRSPSPPTSRDRWNSSPKSPSLTWSPTTRSPGREDRLSITSLSGGSQESSRCVTSANNPSKNFPRDGGAIDGTFSNPNETLGGLHREERFNSGSLRDNRFSTSATRENQSLTNSRKDRSGSDSNTTDGNFVGENRFGSFGAGRSRLRLTAGTTSSAGDARCGDPGASAADQRSEGNGAADVPEARKSVREETSARSSLKALRLALGRDGPLETSPKHARKSSASSSDSSLPPLTSSGSSLSPTTPSKAEREDAIGGHGSLVTPRLGSSSSEAPHASSIALSRDNSTLLNISPSETLQDVISSLAALGSGASSSLSRYPSINPHASKPSTFSEAKVSKYSNISEFRKSAGADPKTTTPASGNAPKFCYECGNKYPVTMAKFCCHCGSRRAAVN